MNQYHMSSEELEISKIKNIQSISVYDLVVPGRKDTDPLVFGIMVSYDNKYLNYCELDGLFNKFKKKVLEQYRVEASEKDIYVDNITRKFLELDKPIELPENIKFYINGKTFNESVFHGAVNKFKKFEQIFKYHISILLDFLEKKYEFGDLKGHINNVFLPTDKTKTYGVNIQITDIGDDSIKLQFGGDFDEFSFFHATISIKPDSISIIIFSEDKKLTMEFNYKLCESGILQESIISVNQECKYYNNCINEQKIEDEKKDFVKLFLGMDGSSLNFDKMYILPWGGYFMNFENKNPLQETYSISTSESSYVELCKDYVSILYFDEINLINCNGHKLKVNGSKKKIDIFRVDKKNVAVMQSHFSPLHYANGLYKENLGDKFFYSIIHFDSFEKPSEIFIENIESESDIDLEYELFERARIKEMKKGDSNGNF